MSYKIQFIGMVCMYEPGTGRIALMPDGRASRPPHQARIAIHDPRPNKDIISYTGNWPNGSGEIAKGNFILDEVCEIDLSGVNTGTGLKTTAHDSRLTNLKDVNRKFKIDPATAVTIARVTITSGELKARRFPGTGNTQDASLLSELTVPHNAVIDITVKTASGPRTIRLKKGSEIAIVNDSGDTSADHFHIFEKLGNGEALGVTPLTKLGTTRSSSGHRVFKKPDPIVDGVRCPNTGCC